MRFSILKNLFLMNLLYVNPQYTALKREKIKNKNKKLQNILFRNLVIQNLFYTFIIFIVFRIVDLTFAANKYKSTLLFILIFTLISVATSFFNMFYEDKDTPNLSILPISEKEIFASKYLTLLSQLFGIIISLTIFNIYANLNFNNFNIISILLIIIFSLSLIFLVFNIFIILFSLMSKTTFFKKNKKVITTIINVIIFVISFSLYFIINKSSLNNIHYKDYKGDFFFNIIDKTTDIKSIINIFILIILCIISFLLLNKIVIKSYFIDIISYSTKKIKIKKEENKNYTNLNFSKIFNKITLKSFSDSTLISQNIVSPLIIPLISIPSIIAIRNSNYIQQSYVILPTIIIISVVFACCCIGNGSFASIAISIDYKNFEFIKTLPINLKKYIFSKLYISLILQAIIVSIIYFSYFIFLNVSLFFLIVGYIIFIITVIFLGIHYFTKDYREPFKTFSNITQLILRGNSQIKLWLLFFLFIFFTLILVFTTVVFTNIYPNLWWLLSTIYFIILIILFSIIYLRFKKYVINEL